jgi:hypothetical protein
VHVDAVTVMQVYWFTRAAVDLDAAHARILGAIEHADPACPWRNAHLEPPAAPAPARRMLRLATAEERRDNATLSATVQPCGTIAIVSRSTATLRRAALHLAESLWT